MKKRFHEYLTLFRRQQGITQVEMAEKLGISRSTYTNYETGKRTPDLEMLEKICDIFECSLDELCGRKNINVSKRNVLREDKAAYAVHMNKKAAPKLAIGIQDFRDLRTKHAYYVDKTNFIEEFMDSWYQITLITRPRRFGKTLNMSMLAEFLDCTKDSSDIFQGTKVLKGDKAKEMNQYPVVFLSFLNVKANQAEGLSESLRIMIRTEYERYYAIINDGRLDEFQKKDFNRIYEGLGKSETKAEYENCLVRSVAVLCQVLYSYYGKKVYLLLDEYDTPFMSANSEGYYEEVRNILNGLLSTSLKGNAFLEKAVLTGIQRVAKENIFSGLNNLVVCTVRDREYETCFGFSEEEVKELLAYCNIKFTTELKQMYDGYRFGDMEVYNPWSVSCYASRKKMESYWVNTSENSILKHALEMQGQSFQKDYETLIREGTVETVADFSMAYYEGMDEAALWGLLVNAGIVTIDEELDEDYYRLRIPNLEVWKVFRELTASHLHIDERQMDRMFQALKRGNVQRFTEEYRRILLELPSYHDLKDENSYHMMMLGMCTFLKKDYVVKSNRETGKGRSDICLYAKSSKCSNVIFEFKYTQDEKEDLEKLAQKAVEQIKEKEYDTDIQGKVLYIGMAHCGKNVCVRWEEKIKG